MDIEKRLTNLENLVYSFIKNQSRIDDYKYADIAGCRSTEATQRENIEANASDIADNRDGIMETFESTLNNETELEDCRNAIIELYEMMEG